MFKKLHWQFTIFCTLATSIILAAMTGICLHISESNALRQNYLAFENNVSSMLSYLESQTIISHRRLQELKGYYGFQVSISDGDTPLFYNLLGHHTNTEVLFDKARRQAQQEFASVLSSANESRRITRHVEFQLQEETFYASVAVIPRETGSLYVTTLYSMEPTYTAIRHQRLLFFSVVLGAIFLLFAFSWFFTRHILTPVEQSQTRQTEFIAAASHELRSPLTIILSSLSALEQASQGEQTPFSQNIREEGQRMKRLIDDLLLLANSDSSRWSFHPRPVEPDTLLLEIFEKYQPLSLEKGIHLHIRLPEHAVPTKEWDRDRMIQALEGLTNNALSYTPRGGSIWMNLRITGGHLEFRIADNGPGIPDDEKSSVFRRFYRADKAHHDRSHFGLGLCIVEEIVRMHRGQIRIEDTPGGGATFVITM